MKTMRARHSLFVLGLVLTTLCCRGAELCPSISLSIDNAETKCSLEPVTVGASFTELPGICDGSAVIYQDKQWTWSVEGVEARPSSGKGNSATFTNISGGEGVITFDLRCRVRACSDCNATHSIATNFTVVKVDIVESNLVLCSYDTSATLNLTGDSYSPGGYVWSSSLWGKNHNGDSVSFDPSKKSPGIYSVIVRSKSRSACSDVCQVSIVRVDLDVDSNLDGVCDDADEVLEDGSGRLVGVNNDDDNANKTNDLEEAGTVLGENDLIPIYLKVDPKMPTGTVILDAPSGGDKIRVWKSASKDEEVHLPMTWYPAAGTVPEVRYIEGIQPSDQSGDVRLRLRYLAGSVECADEISMSVLKVDLDVDCNRDREVKFTADDATASDDKYRFWINNDRDSGDDDEAEDLDPSAGPVDYSDSAIQCQRDLEDFSPLGFKIEAPNGIIEEIHNGTIEVSLAFKNVGGAPTIKLYEAVNKSGQFNYLDDATTAASQAGTMPFKDSMGEVVSGSPFVFPASSAEDLIKELSSSSPDLYLIFEASVIGSGDLVLRLKKGGVTVCESSPVSLDFKDIKKMYEHYTLGDTVTMDAAAIPSTATEVNGFSYTSSSPEENDYILCVHGWRMLPWERRYFAETAYKRLFWINYRGRFGLFSWPTEFCDPAWSEPGNYDRSEQKAWHSGAGLRNLLVALDALYPDRVRVMAHSMGNIVTSEAIRRESVSGSPTRIVHTYIASQAASVAHAYGATGPTNVETDASTDTPEVYAAYPPTGNPYFKGISSVAAGSIVNFCNRIDAALSGWEINQDMKPDLNYDYEYVGLDFSRKRWTYDPWGTKSFILDFPVDTYQIYSFIAEARSLALGADAGTGGEIGGAINLNGTPYGYGNGGHEHSAQFLSTVFRRFTYWETLLDECGIVTP